MPYDFGAATTPVQPHRPVNVEEWRSWRAFADAYVPRVQAGNSVALGRKSYVSFAKYINAIHDRLHPIFEEELQAAREAYPELRTTADLVANIEVVLNQDNGRPVLLGVVKSSGSVIFDAVALAALRRAAPFGAPPLSIVSPGGKVYLHWPFHTDPYEGCAPRNVSPFRLARVP